MGKKKIFTREFFIGAIGITALVLLYFLINFFKGIDLFRMGEIYYLKFNNVSQLVNSSPVYLNGYKAGNVRSINYDYSNMSNILVEVEIDKRVHIPQGSTAKITTHMLGGADISIELSDSKNMLQPGDTITGILDRGIAGEANDKIMPAFDKMLPKADSILVSLNAILSNPALVASLENTQNITEELTTTTKQLNSLLANDIPQITERIVRLQDDLLAVSSQLTDTDYKSMLSKIDSTLTDIQQITEGLNKGEGTAGMLLKNKELYEQLNTTCQAATNLLNDLKDNPKKYVHFSLFGKKQK